MEQQQLIANPFALLLNPEAVHAALQQSTALNRLRSRVWRPLDRSSGPLVAEERFDGADEDQATQSDPTALGVE